MMSISLGISWNGISARFLNRACSAPMNAAMLAAFMGATDVEFSLFHDDLIIG